MTASLSFDGIPCESRVWVVPGVLAEGEVTVDAGVGETAKSLRNLMFAVRLVLGVAQPGEEHGTTHEPARVLWVTSGTEDDPMRDLAPRFAVAVAACAAEFGIDFEQARTALRYIHNLSEWAEGGPVHITDAGLADLRAEVDALNQLDAANRPPTDDEGMPNPAWEGPGPQVRLVVLDPLDALLGEGQTINTRTGARLVMTGLSRFARGAQAAASVIHHVIASGNKIAGSPAVTNSVRLAFISAPDKGNKSVICMRKVKANIAAPADLRYVVATLPAEVAEQAGVPSSAFAAFLGDQAAARGAGDTLRERITVAQGAQPTQGTLRERMRQAAGQRPAQGAQAAPVAPAGTARPWRVLRNAWTGEDQPRTPAYVGGAFPGPDAAELAAQADAGNGPLSWRTDDQGRHVASVADPTGQGRHRVYVAYQADA